MLEDVEESRSFMKRMKRMKSTGEITEPWGTPVLTSFSELRRRKSMVA